jgi:hypothetical protein
MEEHLAHHLRLDGVVTLVDAKHATRHIEEEKPDGVVNEAVEQIAYADRIILNKVMLSPSHAFGHHAFVVLYCLPIYWICININGLDYPCDHCVVHPKPVVFSLHRLIW